MELCANRPISYVPPSPCSRFPLTAANRRFKPSFRLKHSVSHIRVDARNYFSPRASISEETPSEITKFDGEKSRRIVLEKDVTPVENNMFNNSAQEDHLQDDSSLNEQMQPFEDILDKFSLKVDSENTFSLVLYGGGAVLSVWLLSAVVGAVDSIPLFPKFLEVVGLSYSLWFTTRYLLFKENRDELGCMIEELKKQVIGSVED